MSNLVCASQKGELDSKPVILVVEDEILIRVVIADHLRDAGFTVVEADSAQDAIAVITAQNPIDLVFTDVNMPGRMDGQSLANWLLVYRSDIPVILTSGAAKPTLDCGTRSRRFIAKPYFLIDVEAQIRELLRPDISSRD